MKSFKDNINQQFSAKYAYCFKNFNVVDNDYKLYLNFSLPQDINKFIDDLAKFIRYDSSIKTLYRDKRDSVTYLKDHQVKKIMDALEYNTSIKHYSGFVYHGELWTEKLEEVVKKRTNKKNEFFLNDTDLKGMTLLDYYLLEDNTNLLVRKLKEQNQDIESSNAILLNYIFNKNYVGLVEALINDNLNMVNTVDISGSTILFHYVYENNIVGVQKLITQGANVGVINASGFNPLHLAANKGYLEVAKALIDRDHNILNTSNSLGRTALHILVSNNMSQKNTDLIKHLILLGANLNIQTIDDLKITPLHIAAKAGDCETVCILLDAGANPNIENGGGRTPLATAKMAGKTDVCNILKEISHKIIKDTDNTEKVDILELENTKLRAQLEVQKNKIYQLELLIESLSYKGNVSEDTNSFNTGQHKLIGENKTFEDDSDLT